MHDHAERLQQVRDAFPQGERLSALAELFRLFGDATRMRILYALSETELCVCAISELLAMSQSAISHQLKVLKDGKLVDCRREGKTIYYFLSDDHVRHIIDQGYVHITEEKESKA